MNIKEIIQKRLGTIVDVRSSVEFGNGSALDSINIPLQEFPVRLTEIANLKSPLLLCCASGNRSGQAQQYLSQLGIEAYNAGSWFNISQIVSQREKAL
ncbi:MAG: rhodanese-like domain-containing protein [Chitinophagales bacterium]|nr:rhodanese-like domain-containing protein [Chitinophagales bacterium]